MEGIAMKAYEACAVGKQTAMKPRDGGREALERFQHEVRVVEQLERSGKIHILKRHSESQTGHDFVDLVFFERIE